MAFCSKCGQQNRDGASFCRACGNPLRKRTTPQPSQDLGVQAFTPPAQNGTTDVPVFTPPVQNGTTDVPVFTPPIQEGSADIPVFTPPVQGGSVDVPVFTPPVQEESTDIPVFTPPGQDGVSDIPVFTPPLQDVSPAMMGTDQSVPIFTPPTQGLNQTAPVFSPPPRPTFSGPSCHYHEDEPAVARCARCGKYICQDCVDNYQVSGGEYAGQALCYDCCQEMVANNVAELTENKKVIKTQFILSLIGIGIGFFLGFVMGISEGSFGGALGAGFMMACIGGVFLSAMKAYFSLMWETIKTGFTHGWIAAFIAAMIGSIIIGFKCIWITITNTIHYITYLKKTSGFIEEDTRALQQMKDYMEYSLIRSRNVGVDINTLLQQESSLADNSYARMVQMQGEEQAEAFLRDCVNTINENGEIIRSFPAHA